jgi:protein-disulfide isomerase
MSDGSRARARKRKQEREQERRQGKMITIVGAVVVVAVLIFIFFVASSIPSDAPIPETATRLNDLRSSTTQEGFPRLGNPDAPVELVEYSSFSCSACSSFHDEIFPEILPRIRSGEVSFTFVPLATGSVPNPEGANRTALCALEQGKFWEMHEVLFDWHKVFVNSAFTGNRLPAAASGIGLNMDAYNACFRGSEQVNAVLLAAQQQGVTSTPTLRINGTLVTNAFSLEEINQAIDSFGPFVNLTPGTIDGVAPVVDEVATEEAEEMATDEPVEETAEETPAVEATEESGS